MCETSGVFRDRDFLSVGGGAVADHQAGLGGGVGVGLIGYFRHDAAVAGQRGVDELECVGGAGDVGAAAGDGTRWFLTRVTYPYGVATGPGGDLYFSDQGANTVRRIAGS